MVARWRRSLRRSSLAHPLTPAVRDDTQRPVRVRHVGFLSCGLVLWLAVAPSVVSADAIRMGPECPPGTRPVRSHAGTWCVPVPCEEDACGAGYACLEHRLCTVVASVRPGGRGGYGRPNFDAEQVVATCAPDQGCTGTEDDAIRAVGSVSDAPVCEVRRVCLRPALPPFPPMPPASPAAVSDDEPPSPVVAATPAAPAPSSGCGACRAQRSSRAPTLVPVVLLIAWLSRRRGRARCDR